LVELHRTVWYKVKINSNSCVGVVCETGDSSNVVHVGKRNSRCTRLSVRLNVLSV